MSREGSKAELYLRRPRTQHGHGRSIRSSIGEVLQLFTENLYDVRALPCENFDAQVLGRVLVKCY